MQLNNLNTGHFIVIDKIKIESNLVIYREFENSKFKELDFGANIEKYKSKVHEFQSINLVDYLSEETNYYSVCYEYLKSELFSDYEISSDVSNWLFNRPVRVTIINSLVLQNLKPINAGGDLTDLGQLIERVKVEHFGFYKDNEGDITIAIYLNSVTQEDMAVIAPYINNGIYIEIK